MGTCSSKPKPISLEKSPEEKEKRLSLRIVDESGTESYVHQNEHISTLAERDATIKQLNDEIVQLKQSAASVFNTTMQLIVKSQSQSHPNSPLLPPSTLSLNTHNHHTNDTTPLTPSAIDPTLKRELMNVLVAFADQELSISKTESFAQLISHSSLDDTTKQWLTQEYTRDEYDNVSRTRQLTLDMNGPVTNDRLIDLYEDEPVRIPSILDLELLDTWNFDVTQYDVDTLNAYVISIFSYYDLFKRFTIDASIFSNFIHKLNTHYQTCSYHNWYHAVDVLHCVYLYVRKSDVIRKAGLRSLDVLSLFISAIAHDVGHPGVNNLFHIHTRSELAVTYNDVSVLEHFHAATTFRILQDPTCDIFGNLSTTEWMDARKSIISCILASDMSNHFQCVSKLDALFDRLERAQEPNLESPRMATLNTVSTSAPSSTPTFTGQLQPPTAVNISRDDVTLLLNTLLHSADVSNVTKPWNISKLWADRINEEFLLQGDKERSLGLSISPFMDRTNVNQPQMSINFIDFIVAPLISGIVQAFPTLSDIATNLIANRKIWHEKLVTTLSTTTPDTTLRETETHVLNQRASRFRSTFILPTRKITGLMVSPSPTVLTPIGGNESDSDNEEIGKSMLVLVTDESENRSTPIHVIDETKEHNDEVGITALTSLLYRTVANAPIPRNPASRASMVSVPSRPNNSSTRRYSLNLQKKILAAIPTNGDTVDNIALEEAKTKERQARAAST